MITEPLEAYLIHKLPKGETSLRTYFFTREYGVIECTYRGGRHPKKLIHLQPFSTLWILIKEYKQWFYVNKLESTQQTFHLQGHSLFAALYMNELIFYTAAQLEQETLLFIAYQNSLHSLQQTKNATDLEICLRRFEKILLASIGYSLSLDPDSALITTIQPERYYQFRPQQGLQIANTGILGAHILAFAHDQFSDPETLKSAKKLMRQAIHTLLEGRIIQARQLFTKQVSTDVL